MQSTRPLRRRPRSKAAPLAGRVETVRRVVRCEPACSDAFSTADFGSGWHGGERLGPNGGDALGEHTAGVTVALRAVTLGRGSGAR